MRLSYLVCIVALVCSSAHSATSLLISASKADGPWSYTWNGQHDFELGRVQGNLNSRLRVVDGETTTDILRTSFRYIQSQPHAWKPVYILQTESSHDFSEADMLLSIGLRRELKRFGFVEATSGIRYGARTDDEVGLDCGLNFGLKTSFDDGRLTLSLGPKASYASEGSVHASSGELIYDVTGSVEYRTSKSFGIRYTIWVGNTRGNDTCTQVIGLTYTVK